jgi:hypothetical protein
MTQENYELIFTVGAIICVIMMIITVALFIVLKISKVVGSISGLSARKEIKNIQKKKNDNMSKIYKPVTENVSSLSEVTDKINVASKINVTSKISVKPNISSENSKEETELLSFEETTLLNVEENVGDFEVEFDITYINSDKLI